MSMTIEARVTALLVTNKLSGRGCFSLSSLKEIKDITSRLQ